MEIVEYLKPKFVLMENVVDIIRFSEGFLGRYALSKLIHLNYQVRMGMMAAGAYGLPQFRMRVFFWGARPTEVSFFITINIKKLKLWFNWMFAVLRNCRNIHFQHMML